jgi:hypothetical protein
VNGELIAQIITLIVLILTMVFEVRNFIKYRLKNGANQKRIILFLTTACFTIHTIRLIMGNDQGFFFGAGVIFFLLLFFDERIKAFFFSKEDIGEIKGQRPKRRQ